MNDANKEAERLLRLLDVATESVLKGDGQSTNMALEEALKAAERLLPKKEIK